MTRTLQTAQQGLEFLISRNVPTIALAELQETTTNKIDIGHPVSELQRDWPKVNFTHVDPIFPSKEGVYAFEAAALLERGAQTRKWLQNRPERVIAVVSHGGFMRIGLCNRKFGNADWRVFELEDIQSGDNKGSRLIEWETTEQKGGGLGLSERGSFGWEVHDFKYMPGNEGLPKEELEAMCHNTSLR